MADTTEKVSGVVPVNTGGYGCGAMFLLVIGLSLLAGWLGYLMLA